MLAAFFIFDSLRRPRLTHLRSNFVIFFWTGFESLKYNHYRIFCSQKYVFSVAVRAGRLG